VVERNGCGERTCTTRSGRRPLITRVTLRPSALSVALATDSVCSSSFGPP
jgi:hypothetical protein